MKARLNFKGKKLEFEVEKVTGFKKILGLMFKKSDAKALLFEFDKEVLMSIHSFFCPDFVAIWLNQGKIIDHQVIIENKLNIKPKKKFDKLIEIPLNEQNSEVVKFLVGK